MRKMFFILFIIGSLCTLNSCNRKSSSGSDAKGIQFEKGSLNEVLSKAKIKGKPVFMDVYASWCGPCREMERTVFRDAKVAEFFNANFINYRVDGEKGEGVNIVKKYRIQGYPSLIYLDADGKPIHVEFGAVATSGFLNMGKKALQKVR